MTTKFEENMAKKFNLEEPSKDIAIVKPTEVKTIPVGPTQEEKDVIEDYEATRDNLEDLISMGKDAIEKMIEIAQNNEEARSFEVVATLIKTVTEANRELLETQLKMKNLRGGNDKGSTTNIGNVDKAIIFSGSTSDLTRLIKKTMEPDEVKTIDGD